MDDADGPTASLIFFFCLLLVDIFFYGFSEAVRALNEKEIEVRTENKKDKKSIRLYRIIQDPSRYVNTLQLVITLSNIIMGVWYLDFFLVRVRGFLDNLSKQYFPGVTSSNACSNDVFCVIHSIDIWCTSSKKISSAFLGKMGICNHYTNVLFFGNVKTFNRFCDGFC